MRLVMSDPFPSHEEFVVERYEPDVDEWWEVNGQPQTQTKDEAIERAKYRTQMNGMSHRVVRRLVSYDVVVHYETVGKRIGEMGFTQWIVKEHGWNSS